MFVLEIIKPNKVRLKVTNQNLKSNLVWNPFTKLCLEHLWYSPLRLAKRLSSVTQIIAPESELVCAIEIAELTVLLTF